MIKELFIGSHPSRFQKNNLIKALIVADSLLWASNNMIAPIFAIFAMQDIAGGSLELAATGFSVHLIARIIFELMSGRFLGNTSVNLEYKKYIVAIIGVLVTAISYFGFSYATSIAQYFLYYIVMGAGIGFSAPARQALFSAHLDSKEDALEWGVHDAIIYITMACSGALGGFIAQQYGFHIVFIIAGIGTIISAIPYAINMHKLES